MTNLDGLCQGGPEGESIQKLPGLVKQPKNKQKGSLEESCESLIVGTADGREERESIRTMYVHCTVRMIVGGVRMDIVKCRDEYNYTIHVPGECLDTYIVSAIEMNACKYVIPSWMYIGAYQEI